MKYFDIKYEKVSESQDKYEKQKNWNIAFGMQAVDNLTPSKYMVDLAKENIEGFKNYEAVESEINTYYQHQNEINLKEKEADEVSIRIVKILQDKSFTFNYLVLKQYHGKLFEGLNIGIDEKYIGEFRDYNITKIEEVLDGDTVQYADYSMIEETLRYDFSEEEKQNYIEMTDEQKVERISKFTSDIWQVHPFGEGNTRTCALFVQKYLISKGFEMNNELFKDNSKYFRDALVLANYSNISKGIEANDKYLKMFFENLL